MFSFSLVLRLSPTWPVSDGENDIQSTYNYKKRLKNKLRCFESVKEEIHQVIKNKVNLKLEVVR